MESIEQAFFRRYRPDYSKLLKYGFRKSGEEYRYRASFCDGDFYAELTVLSDGTVRGQVFDADSDDEYLPIRNRYQIGAFVGHVREAYFELLQQIADAAFLPVPFTFDQSNRIADRIRMTYGVQPEFPWKDDNEDGIFRHAEGGKWFAALLTVKRNKLVHTSASDLQTAGSAPSGAPATSGVDSGSQDKASIPPDTLVEVINLKAPVDKIPELTAHPGIFRAWHMNKKHWISVLLDDTLSDKVVMALVETSHQLTHTGKTGTRSAAGGRSKNGMGSDSATSGRRADGPAAWLIPAAPARYDVAAGFAGGRTIWWHQHTDVVAGDEVYIYYGRPYSAIMFRCQVLVASAPPERTGYDPSELNPNHTRYMELALLESYPPDRFPLPFLKAHGGSVCRSARRMPEELLAAISA